MNKKTMVWVLLVVILGGLGAAYYYWQMSSRVAPPPPPPPPPAVQPAPSPTPISKEPAIQHPIEEATTPPAQPEQPLPKLVDSDTALHQALAGLLGEKTLARYFFSKLLIRRIVATVDNLPRRKAPVNMWPVKPVGGPFLTTGKGDTLAVSDDNAVRYARYVRIAQAIDAHKLVEIYVHFYPLFQHAYQDLGYPKGYFNDRLIEAIDDLLDAPELKQPVRLTQPKVLYEFADPGLESRSAGQKIMMRMGSDNEAKIKAKLREIRAELTRHEPSKQ